MRNRSVVGVAVLAALTATTAVAQAASDRGRTPTKAKRAVVIPQGHSVIALARGSATPVYAQRGARQPTRLLGRGLYGSRRVFLVDWPRRRWTWPGWVRVHLPGRPNGSRGWVRARDVRFQLDSYRIDVNLTRRVLTVRRSARAVLHTPIGVGRDVWPTPTGRYYLTELIRTTNPGGAYGPYAFGTSAYSSVLTSFGRGEGQVGIHGTNQPWLVGKAVSHGCIRLDNDAIVRLAKTVPLGTPVRIFREGRLTRGAAVPRPQRAENPQRPPVISTRERPAAPWTIAPADVLALTELLGVRPLTFVVALWRDLIELDALASIWRQVTPEAEE